VEIRLHRLLGHHDYSSAILLFFYFLQSKTLPAFLMTIGWRLENIAKNLTKLKKSIFGPNSNMHCMNQAEKKII